MSEEKKKPASPAVQPVNTKPVRESFIDTNGKVNAKHENHKKSSNKK